MPRAPHETAQLRLFDEPAPGDDRPGHVGLAPVSTELAKLARSLPAGVRLGTSSWSFPGWVGIVYDRRAAPTELARHGLAAYGRHVLLRAVGLDRTYYAPLCAAELAAYAAVVADDFRFLVKAPATCSSPWEIGGSAGTAARNAAFLDAGWAAEYAVAPFVEGLGAKGGALVFQLVPLGAEWTRRPQLLAERLARFLGALPRGPLYAVELRDRALLTADYVDALASVGTTHCFNVHPRMPPVEEQARLAGRVCTRAFVARWMLHAGLEYESARRRYEPFGRLVDEDPASRAALAELAVFHARAGRDVLVVANNKAEGSAPLSVFRLAEAIGERLRAQEGVTP